jgi:uncharacterized membrane protein YcfT
MEMRYSALWYLVSSSERISSCVISAMYLPLMKLDVFRKISLSRLCPPGRSVPNNKPAHPAYVSIMPILVRHVTIKIGNVQGLYLRLNLSKRWKMFLSACARAPSVRGGWGGGNE